MKRIIILALLCAACAHPAPTPAPAVTHPAAVAPISTRATCVIPPPPTADDLAAAQAARGLIGRDALLTAYAKLAFTAKAACH